MKAQITQNDRCKFIPNDKSPEFKCIKSTNQKTQSRCIKNNTQVYEAHFIIKKSINKSDKLGKMHVMQQKFR